MRERPPILHVLAALKTGGVEVNTIRLTSALLARGWRQLVACLTPDPDAFLQSQLPDECLIVNPRSGWLAGAKLLSQVVQEHGVGIVHGRNFSTWQACVLARAFCLPSPCWVQSFHGPGSFLNDPIRRRLSAMMYSELTDAYMAVSEDIAHRLGDDWAIPESKTRIISNGIDTDYFQPADKTQAKRQLQLDESSFVVGAVGSLYEVKNTGLLLRVFSQVTPSAPQSLLMIVGDGPLLPALEDQARELKIADRVRFYGRQKDVRPFLQAMDVFVQPSYREGSPTAVLEAMSCAVPCVAGPSAGCVELQKKYEVPLIAESHQDEPFVRLLQKLACDEACRKFIGEQSRRVVKHHYGFEQMVDAYEQFYDSLLTSTGVTHQRGAAYV